MASLKKVLSAILALALILSCAAAFAEDVVELTATVAKPTITVKNVINGKEVVLSSTSSSVKIYYTTDGTTPTNSSALYSSSSPIVLSTAGTYTIKAIAYSGSSKSSAVTETVTLEKVGISPTDSGVCSLSLSNDAEGNVTSTQLSINLDSDYSVYYRLGKTHSSETFNYNDSDVFLYEGRSLTFYKATYIQLAIYRKGYAPSDIKTLTDRSYWGKDTFSTPTFKTSSFYGGRTLTIDCSDKVDGKGEEVYPDCIYYKIDTAQITDELTPDNSSLYANPISLTEAGKYYVKAYAACEGWFDSDQTSGKNYFEITKCDTPSISYTGSSRKTVTITSAESDVDIFYTTNGIDPTTSSAKYSASFVVTDTNITIKAIACKKGSVNSDVGKCVIGTGSTVTLSVPTSSTETAANGVKTLTLKSSDGADIYYMMFESKPESSSYDLTVSTGTLYTQPLVFDKTGTYYIVYRAYAEGKYSSIKGGEIKVAVTETVTAAKTTLENGAVYITLTAEEGCDIYYVTEEIKNASDIAISSENLYTYPITYSSSGYIAAVAVKTVNGEQSVSSVYAATVSVTGGPITLDKVGEITVKETNTASGVRVTLSCADSDADLFYTVDKNADTAATTGDTKYTGAFEVSTGGYVHVVAAKPGYEYAYKTQSLNVSKTAEPTVEAVPSGSSYILRFACETDGAEYYYTTDCTTPTTSSAQATSGLAVVDSGVTLKFIAVANGYEASNVVTKILSEGDISQCGEVLFTESNVIGGKELMLTDLTPRTTVYYTLDGTDPTVDSNVYENRLSFTSAGTYTVRAIAVRSGYYDSEIYEYTVTLTALTTPYAKSSSSMLNVDGSMIYNLYLGNESEPAKIYYTTDGSVPVVGSDSTKLFTGSYIYFYEDGMLRIMAAAEGYANSSVNNYTVTIPEITGVGGATVLSTEAAVGGTNIYFASSTEGASFFFLIVEGTESTGVTASEITTPCGGENGNMVFAPYERSVVWVKTVKSGLAPTVMKYNVTNGAADAPTASVASNSVVKAGTAVELIGGNYTDSEGAERTFEVFYTLDGTAPTLESDVYTEPIEITSGTLIRAAAAGYKYALSEIADFYYGVEGESYAIDIDISNLTRVGANGIEGSIKLGISGLEDVNGRAYVALYRNNELLAVRSAALAESVTFDDIAVLAEGTVIVKAFVFLDDGSIQPVCTNSIRAF